MIKMLYQDELGSAGHIWRKASVLCTKITTEN